MDTKILIVDNDLKTCRHLSEILQKEGYYTDIAHSPEQASRFDLNSYSLFVSEVNFKRESGTEFLKRIRHLNERDYAPFIFYSEVSDSSIIVECLNSGADDYLLKSEEDAVFVAKADCVIRRIEAAKNISGKFRHSSNYKDLNFKNIRIDRNHKKVFVDSIDCSLTRHEFELIYYLFENLDTVKSRKSIMYKVWDKDPGTYRTVDTTITRLRKKLGAAAGYIKTQTGYGYCFSKNI